MIPCARVRPLSGPAAALVLSLVVAGGLWIRVAPPWPAVFRDGRVVLLSNDPWIHARQADRILERFPRPQPFDPLRLHPGGQANEAPLFPLTLATTAWALGGGAPSAALVDRVIAWIPAVLGALVALPVFALGRRLFGAATGLLAASVVALLPGQLLQRSLLGYADHHVAECLLSVLVLSSLAAAVERSGRQRLLWALVTGLCLGAYLLTWAHGILLPLVLTLWACVQIAIEHGRGSGSASWRVVGPAFGIAAVLAAPLARWPGMQITLPTLVVGAAAVYGATITSQALERRGRGRSALLFAMLAAALALTVLVSLVAPSWVGELLALARRFDKDTAAATIGETRPLLFLSGRFSMAPVWNELRTSALLGLAGLVLLFRQAVRERKPAQTLLFVWSLVTLALTFGQVRFGYYLAPAVAILAALAVSRLVRGLNPAFAAVAAICLAVYPVFPPAWAAARAPAPGPSEDWLETLDWIRRETPAPGESPAYGVVAWCDYGYWLTRIAQRAPTANPTQHGATEVAAFLLETDEDEARRRLAALDARYLVLDSDLLPAPLSTTGPVWIGQLDTLVRWAGRPASDYYQVLFEKDASGIARATVAYTPAYYRSMLVRLAVFGGRAAEPRDSAFVIDVEAAERQGRAVEAVKEARGFAMEAEAREFLAKSSTESGSRRLLGRDPFRTCVTIAPLSGYSLRHTSPGSVPVGDGRRIPAVAVFEADRSAGR
jgi:oligosaccharyl transferase (archaeosortase A-associated)